MSLERVIAAPFQQSGERSLSEHQFVVGLSLHRDWFSPAQAKRVVELATAEGLLEREEDVLVPTIDPQSVELPTTYEPDESVLNRRSTFEAMLDRIVAAGCEKREAVGAINRLQGDLHLTIEAAAALYAARQGIDLDEEIDRALAELRDAS